ncbi:MAG: hypothetical protein IJN92_02525 [Lachnospiraceae bacterium]|nr:hypothetical protein [Lachnospiraceae bacterium]
MNTKNIPAIMTLSAGAITSIITFLLRYEVKTMLGILLLVLLIFYGTGLFVKYILDKFQADVAKKEAEEERLRKEEEARLAAEKEEEEEKKKAAASETPEAE